MASSLQWSLQVDAIRILLITPSRHILMMSVVYPSLSNSDSYDSIDCSLWLIERSADSDQNQKSYFQRVIIIDSGMIHTTIGISTVVSWYIYGHGTR